MRRSQTTFLLASVLGQRCTHGASAPRDQPLRQTFSFDAGTAFLHWNAGAPYLLDSAAVKPGDRVVLRTRAPRGTSLAQLVAAPLWKVNDHEPQP